MPERATKKLILLSSIFFKIKQLACEIFSSSDKHGKKIFKGY